MEEHGGNTLELDDLSLESINDRLKELEERFLSNCNSLLGF